MDYLSFLLESVGLGEMATKPPENLASMTFYHGTSSKEAARSIMKNGLQPPKLEGRGSLLTPVQGMVYLTPDIAYAAIYAVGGSFLGNKSFQVPFRGEENKKRFDYVLKDRHGKIERFGYVFEVPGEQLQMVQPDEDEVGELYHFILDRPPSEHYPKRDHEIWAKLNADPYQFRRFKYHMDNWTTDTQKRRIKDGELAYYASGGKRAIAKMDDDMKSFLSGIGVHVAHQGMLKPTAVYEIDKTKVGWINKDGSNFFEIAKKIR